MISASQQQTFVIPDKRPQATRSGIQFSNVHPCTGLDSGFALSARPGMTSVMSNPSADGGSAIPSGAGGAGSSERQP